MDQLVSIKIRVDCSDRFRHVDNIIPGVLPLWTTSPKGGPGFGTQDSSVTKGIAYASMRPSAFHGYAIASTLLSSWPHSFDQAQSLSQNKANEIVRVKPPGYDAGHRVLAEAQLAADEAVAAPLGGQRQHLGCETIRPLLAGLPTEAFAACFGGGHAGKYLRRRERDRCRCPGSVGPIGTAPARSSSVPWPT